jgi:hypothetical protein
MVCCNIYFLKLILGYEEEECEGSFQDNIQEEGLMGHNKEGLVESHANRDGVHTREQQKTKMEKVETLDSL